MNLTASIFRGAHGARRWPLVLVALVVLIHIPLVYNALRHDPLVGYDAEEHLNYVRALSSFSLPDTDDTREFFSPPLPYLLPAMLRASGVASDPTVFRAALLLNVAFSVGLFVFLWKICQLLRPNSAIFKLWTFALLGALPAYYKSFAFIRGEPLLAFLAVAMAYTALKLWLAPAMSMRRQSLHYLALGLLLGGILLSRQWGFFLLPAVGLLAIVAPRAVGERLAVRMALVIGSIGVAAIVAGGFYLHLYRDHGSATAFNRSPHKQFALSNQPLSFYTGLSLHQLFTDPARPAFANQLFPVFYAELWGDYQCYFLIYGWDSANNRHLRGDELLFLLNPPPERPYWYGWRRRGPTPPAGEVRPRLEDLMTNRREMASYLGQAHRAAVGPSIVLLAGVIWGTVAAALWLTFRLRGKSTEADPRRASLGFFILLVAGSFLGYFWFLLHYPSLESGNTIKATYMLQTFPFIALLSADVLAAVQRRRRWLHLALAAILAVCIAYQVPLFFTRTVSHSQLHATDRTIHQVPLDRDDADQTIDPPEP